MILTELFDQAAPHEMNGTSGKFEINGKSYTIDIVSPDEPGVYEVSFHLTRDKPTDGKHEVYGITKTGDEIAVFSTVINIIKEFVAKTQIKELIFAASAKEPSRVRLYDRLVRRLGLGWRLDITMDSMNKVYILVNPNYKPPEPQATQDHPDVPF